MSMRFPSSSSPTVTIWGSGSSVLTEQAKLALVVVFGGRTIRGTDDFETRRQTWVVRWIVFNLERDIALHSGDGDAVRASRADVERAAEDTTPNRVAPGCGQC